MGPAYYVLAILGCGEGEAACRQVAVAEARYESLDACNAATPDAVMRGSDIAFPVVVAQCRRADAPVAESLTPDQVDLPPPARRPDVRRAALAARKPVRG